MHDLISVRQVADRFGLPISTLHYWERRGLITPHRRGGTRWYDTDQVYRVALIQRWREQGLLSVEEISRALPSNDDWRETIARHIEEIEEQRAALDRAHAYLRRMLNCRHGDDGRRLEQCPEFRREVDGAA